MVGTCEGKECLERHREREREMDLLDSSTCEGKECLEIETQRERERLIVEF